MKAFLVKALIYVAKTLVVDAIKRELTKAGKSPTEAEITAKVAAAKLESVSETLAGKLSARRVG